MISVAIVSGFAASEFVSTTTAKPESRNTLFSVVKPLIPPLCQMVGWLSKVRRGSPKPPGSQELAILKPNSLGQNIVGVEARDDCPKWDAHYTAARAELKLLRSPGRCL